MYTGGTCGMIDSLRRNERKGDISNPLSTSWRSGKLTRDRGGKGRGKTVLEKTFGKIPS